MSDILEESIEEVFSLDIQLPIDLIEYIEEIKKELNCNISEAITYLIDIAIEVFKVDENSNKYVIKKMFNIGEGNEN